MTRFVSHPVAQAREATKWSPFGVSRQSLEVEFCELRFLGELRPNGVLRSSFVRSCVESLRRAFGVARVNRVLRITVRYLRVRKKARKATRRRSAKVG